MTTSQHKDSSTRDKKSGARQDLRLLLTPGPAAGPLDGGWWPRSRDIDVELRDLVDQLPADVGRVSRALYSPPDWDASPRSVRVEHGWVKTGSFPRDDTHLMVLRLSRQSSIQLLVVPPDHPEGQAALERAADPSNGKTASQLLDTSAAAAGKDA